ncbi:Unannotated [Lentimonas sp. CC19]|nr:Unannotated [Lentimonas sp. CC10]CAA6693118.1 Unannotated [Lentimonas sp. CC19]CAA7068999.1 Unannotated [Lentimonas sp. CC11]
MFAIDMIQALKMWKSECGALRDQPLRSYQSQGRLLDHSDAYQAVF